MKKKVFRAISLLMAAMLLVAFAVPAMAETVDMKIATWTSNAGQLELLGGFVQEFAQKKGIEINCTFETLVRLQREKLEREVANVLFK